MSTRRASAHPYEIREASRYQASEAQQEVSRPRLFPHHSLPSLESSPCKQNAEQGPHVTWSNKMRIVLKVCRLVDDILERGPELSLK